VYSYFLTGKAYSQFLRTGFFWINSVPIFQIYEELIVTTSKITEKRKKRLRSSRKFVPSISELKLSIKITESL
jgi:hypothetical protein